MAVKSLTRSGVSNFVDYSSSMNAGYTGADFELIQTVFVNNPISSVAFDLSSLASMGYKHLQIRAVVRDNRSGFAGSNCYLRINNAGALYSHHSLYGTGSSTGGGAATSTSQIYLADIAGGGATGDAFSCFIVDVLDFSSAVKNKTVRTFGGTNAGYNWVTLSSGQWLSTNPATSITILDLLGSFIVGSRFSLYGVRG